MLLELEALPLLLLVLLLGELKTPVDDEEGVTLLPVQSLINTPATCVLYRNNVLHMLDTAVVPPCNPTMIPLLFTHFGNSLVRLLTPPPPTTLLLLLLSSDVVLLSKGKPCCKVYLLQSSNKLLLVRPTINFPLRTLQPTLLIAYHLQLQQEF